MKKLICITGAILFATCCIAQTKTDILTLTGGYIKSAANGGGHLLFVDEAKHDVDARTIDSCFVGDTEVPIWDTAVDCPPCGLYFKFHNRKFRVTYLPDSIQSPDGDNYVPIIAIQKMVLLQ